MTATDPHDTLRDILEEVSGAPLEPARIDRLIMGPRAAEKLGVRQAPAGGHQLTFQTREHDRFTWGVDVEISHSIDDDGTVLARAYVMTVDLRDEPAAGA